MNPQTVFGHGVNTRNVKGGSWGGTENNEKSKTIMVPDGMQCSREEDVCI